MVFYPKNWCLHDIQVQSKMDADIQQAGHALIGHFNPKVGVYPWRSKYKRYSKTALPLSPNILLKTSNVF